MRGIGATGLLLLWTCGFGGGCAAPEEPGTSEGEGEGEGAEGEGAEGEGAEGEGEPPDGGLGDGGEPDGGAPDGGDPDGGAPAGGEPLLPGKLAPFTRFCRDRASWDADLTPGVLGELSGAMSGAYEGLPPGSLLNMKVIPDTPFQVTGLRFTVVGDPGPVRLRIMKSFGNSYPDLEDPEGDLVPPQELEVADPNGAEPVILDLSSYELYLLPNESYILVYEQQDDAPLLAVEELPPGEISRGQMLIPGEDTPYGVDGNFRLELLGNGFCRWSAEERWFGQRADTGYGEVNSQRVAVSDLDGDGHDDVVLNDGRPVLFLGDGRGGLARPDVDPFPPELRATMLVFADVDNDGDEDAFAAVYVGADGDGDGVTLDDEDCDDTQASVQPGADEDLANGRDDDCDRIADDGLGEEDEDEDGVTILAGDCDDTRDDVFPGAPELLDARDNDCDGEADEDFVHQILLNDGTGRFTVLADSGVEYREPTAAAAFGDGDADGLLDLYWGNWLVHYPEPEAMPDRYARGTGAGIFDEVTARAGMEPGMGPSPCYGVLWSDYDNDADQDVLVLNYGYSLNYLWQNDGTGGFRDVGNRVGIARDGLGVQGGNTFGGDWGDIDNDGDLDLFEANIAHPRYRPWSDPSLLLINQGPPDYTFVESREALGVRHDEGDVNAAFGDFDNDMDLDLVVCSLYPTHYSRLYRNDGPRGFTNVTYETGTAVHESVSPAWADLDGDGDLDLLIADRAGVPYLQVFENRIGQERGWLLLLLQGTTSNRDGIGARVTLTADGVTQIREVKGGGGHSNTQGSRWVHFGLGDEETIERLTVRWVGGETEEITGLQPRQRYRIVEGSGTGEVVPTNAR